MWNCSNFKFVIACEQDVQSVPSKNKDDTKGCIKRCYPSFPFPPH